MAKAMARGEMHGTAAIAPSLSYRAGRAKLPTHRLEKFRCILTVFHRVATAPPPPPPPHCRCPLPPPRTAAPLSCTEVELGHGLHRREAVARGSRRHAGRSSDRTGSLPPPPRAAVAPGGAAGERARWRQLPDPLPSSFWPGRAPAAAVTAPTGPLQRPIRSTSSTASLVGAQARSASSSVAAQRRRRAQPASLLSPPHFTRRLPLGVPPCRATSPRFPASPQPYVLAHLLAASLSRSRGERAVPAPRRFAADSVAVRVALEWAPATLLLLQLRLSTSRSMLLRPLAMGLPGTRSGRRGPTSCGTGAPRTVRQFGVAAPHGGDGAWRPWPRQPRPCETWSGRRAGGRRGERDCRNGSCDHGRISPHHPPVMPAATVSRFSASIQTLHRGDSDGQE
ncbi:formin-like protein 6 [Panicum virgatum]|uniref:Uncharacterized protein n=1 Tax=Panicum virgatum TaxID=38727 RepID=A0A8T0UCT7_PANVG|nr:formin-like protein 6 [Panicum virgatum]KAG2618866.1 hypothetical protein PVAP13_3NG141359 [Panicum virgatum]